MLALLRAIRLRLAAPEAAAAGAADTQAALAGAPAPESADTVQPDWVVHPHWPSADQQELPAAHPFRELSAREVPRIEQEEAAVASGFPETGRISGPSAAVGPVPRGPRNPYPAPQPSPPGTSGDASGQPPVTPAKSSGPGSAGPPPSAPATGPAPAADWSEPDPSGWAPGTVPPLPDSARPQPPGRPGTATPPGTTPPGTTPPGTTPPGTTPPPTTGGGTLPGAMAAGTQLPGRLQMPGAVQLPGAQPGYGMPASVPVPPTPVLPGTVPPGGQLPAIGPGATPGQLPTTAPGQLPTTAPGQLPTTAPGQVPTTAPGQVPTTAPGQVPTVSGQVPTAPGRVPIPTLPGQLPAATPGQLPVPAAPGQLPVPAAPGRPPATVPGQLPTPATPGQLPSATPGHLPGGLPGTGPPPGSAPVPPRGDLPLPATPPGNVHPGPVPPRSGTDPARPGSTTPYPPGAGPWVGRNSMSAGPEPISGIPAIGGARIAGAPWKDDLLQGVNPSVPVRMSGPVPPATPRPVTPADGMDPADDALLQQVQRLISTSVSLAGGTEDVAGRLHAALVQAQPALFAKIPGSPLSQTEQLAQALTWLVHNLDRPPALVAGCGMLGAALAECG
ncbi:MAG: hypothetical protein ABW000_23625, partial [Actinoplanes sp.]